MLGISIALSPGNPSLQGVLAGYIGRSFAGTSQSPLTMGPIGASDLMIGAAKLTLLCRVRPSGSGNRDAIGIDIGGAAGPSLGLGTGNVVRAGARSQAGDTFQSKSGATGLSAGEWHTIATVIDIANDTMDVYADGLLDTSGANTVTFGASTYTPSGTYSLGSRIGANPPVSAPWSGDIADVAIWTRALSVEEIASIHNGLRPHELDAGQPVIYFPLSEEIDRSGTFAKALIGGLEGVPLATPPVASTGTKPPHMRALSSSRRPETKFRSTRTLRIRGAYAEGIGDGNAVPAVAMKGGVDAVQATAGNRPVYKDGGYLKFTAANSHWLSANVGKVDIKRGVTIVTLLDAHADGRLFSLGSSATNDLTGAIAFSPVNGLMVAGPSGICYGGFTDYTVGSSGKALFSGRFSGNEIANWLNGSRRNAPTASGGTERSNGDLRPTSLPTAQTTQTLEIGRRIGSTNLYIDADLYDAIIVFGNLTDEEVAYYEGVIAWENASTDLLPVDHPWKNVAPTASSDIAYPWGNSIVARSPLPATSFVGSPCIIKCSDAYYALHDYFNSTLDNTGRLWTSRDGKEWNGLVSFANFQWGTIWEHTDGNLYILALTRFYGDIKIGKSTDRGKTWTFNTLSKTGGPLTAAGAGSTAPNYHRAGGISHAYHDGHIFFAFENNDPGSSPSGFKSGVLYVPDDADLMDETQWSATSQLAIGATSFAGVNIGMLEGNIVVDALGDIYNVLRFGYSTDGPNHAVFIPLGWDGTTLTMPSWSSSFVKDLPGGNVKFQFVESDGYLWTLANENVALAGGVGGNNTDERDRVTLVRGQFADLSSPSFTSVSTVIDQTALGNGLSAADQTLYSGFQYPSMAVDGSGFMALYRVSWSGANTYHDSNFIGAGRVSKPA